MPIVIIAKPEAEYKQWLAEPKKALGHAEEEPAPTPVAQVAEVHAPTAEPAAPVAASGDDKSHIIAEGQKVYEAHCASCHQAGGEGIPGLFPAIKDSKVVNGPVSDHIALVVNGKPPLMASFKNILKPEEVAAVITFQRNSFGNNTGDVVHASDVLAHH